MKRSIVAVLFGLAAIFTAAQAQSPAKTPASPAFVAPTPVGEWLVEDGSAHIRVVSCDAVLWGILSWAKEPGGLDENNPDKSKRSRSVIGIPILLGMKPNGSNNWKGQVYDAESGRTYTSYIKLASNDVLRIDGCVAGGMICGGEDWKRVAAVAGKVQTPEKDICTAMQIEVR